MEIVERYVYAVVQRIPEKGKKELENEIRSLIYEMMESYEEMNNEEEKAIRALEELGDPHLLAEKYRGAPRYLIGPKYFEMYLFILKIVLLSVFLGLTVATIVGTRMLEHGFITDYISSMVSGVFQSIAWVTVIFAGFEYFGVDLMDKSQTSFSVASLPQVPHKKAKIKKGETIFSIVFLTIFFQIFYFAPQFIGAYQGGGVYIPIFNIKALEEVKLLILAMFITGILREVVKLLYGRWTIQSSVIYTIFSILSTGFTLGFFFNKNIWNNNFTGQFNSAVQGASPELQELAEVFTLMGNWGFNILILIIVITTIFEISRALYYGIRYGNKNSRESTS